jgi:alkylation response protein AidB-like acyl-CoA dehydrogenase
MATGMVRRLRRQRHQSRSAAPNCGLYQLVDVTAEEKAIVKKERTYVETGVEPIINKCWSDDEFPFKLLPSFKELGLGDLGYEGYCCARGSQKLFEFVAMEIARVDAALCTLFGVLSGLPISSIYLDGSEGCHQCRVGKKIGCFDLTEPLVGAGTSGGLPTTAGAE